MDTKKEFMVTEDKKGEEIILKVSKGVLKARFSHYVLYDIEFLRKHIDRERELILRGGHVDGV